MDLNDFILPYTDLYAVYLAVGVLVSVLLFSVKSRQADAVLSVDNTDFLKGLSVVFVAVHHATQRIWVNETVVDRAVQSLNDLGGSVAVGLFFFLSGYGLSVGKRTDLRFLSFLKLKVFRVYIPCVVVNLVAASILQRQTLWSLSPIGLDNTQWFVVVILGLYVVDYVVGRLNAGTAGIYLVVLAWVAAAKLLHLDFWWYISSLCFPLGYTWQRNAAFITRIISRRFPLVFAASLVLLAISYWIQTRHVTWGMVSAMVFCLCIVLMVAKWNPTNRGMKIIGRSSLEIYVLHMKLAWILVYLADDKPRNSFPLAVYFVCVIAVGIGFSKINQAILAKIKSRYKSAPQPG